MGEKIISNEFYLGGQCASLKVRESLKNGHFIVNLTIKIPFLTLTELMYVHETGLCNLQVYPNGTVGNKGHVSIFLENKSEEPLHISEVVFTFQASGAAPLTWNAPKKELESEDDWGFQRLVGVNIEI